MMGKVTYFIIIIHEFHRDASLETKLQGRYWWGKGRLAGVGARRGAGVCRS